MVAFWLSASTGLLFSTWLRLKAWQNFGQPWFGTSNFQVAELVVFPSTGSFCVGTLCLLFVHIIPFSVVWLHIRFQFLRPSSVVLRMSLFLQLTPVVFLSQAFLRYQLTCIHSCPVIRWLASWAAVGTAWSLVGSPLHGQAAFYLFQKHLLRWQYIYSFSHCGCFWDGY